MVKWQHIFDKMDGNAHKMSVNHEFYQKILRERGLNKTKKNIYIYIYFIFEMFSRSSNKDFPVSVVE